MRTMMTMIAMLILTVTCTEAHDIYTGLKDHRGQFDCCHETDCRPAHYRVTAAGVDMLLDDEWVRLPNEIIQYRTLHGDTGETRAAFRESKKSRRANGSQAQAGFCAREGILPDSSFPRAT